MAQQATPTRSHAGLSTLAWDLLAEQEAALQGEPICNGGMVGAHSYVDFDVRDLAVARRLAGLIARVQTGRPIVRVCRHCGTHVTSGFARTWTAYDGLSVAEGWKERAWYCAPDSNKCESDAPLAELHVQKEITIGGLRIVVYPPVHARNTLVEVLS